MFSELTGSHAPAHPTHASNSQQLGQGGLGRGVRRRLLVTTGLDLDCSMLSPVASAHRLRARSAAHQTGPGRDGQGTFAPGIRTPCGNVRLDMRLAIRLIGLLFVLAAILGAYNFFSIGAAGEAAARAAACAGRGPRCTPVMTRLERTAFWQDVHFRVGGRMVQVRCARSAYLLGQLRCSARP
jgi:hypothetical protein